MSIKGWGRGWAAVLLLAVVVVVGVEAKGNRRSQSQIVGSSAFVGACRAQDYVAVKKMVDDAAQSGGGGGGGGGVAALINSVAAQGNTGLMAAASTAGAAASEKDVPLKRTSLHTVHLPTSVTVSCCYWFHLVALTFQTSYDMTPLTLTLTLTLTQAQAQQ
jgi:hypothetical protein